MRRTLETDYERFAENLRNARGGSIFDKESMALEAEQYLDGESNALLDAGNMDKVWSHYSRSAGLKDVDSIHKEHGGKSLRRDRLKTSQIVVTDIKDYKDSTKMDLKNYDTKQRKRKGKKIKTPRTAFKFFGKQQGKIKASMADVVVIKGKPHARRRDKNGMFVSFR